MLAWGRIQTRQNRLDKNIKKTGGEKARNHRHSLSSTSDKQTGDTFGWGDQRRPEFAIDTDRSDMFRIPRSRTTRYLYTVVDSNGHSDTQSIGRQINNTHRQAVGVRGQRSGGKMEECLGVNVRPVVRWIVIWKSDNMSRWCNFVCVRIIRFVSEISFPQWMNTVVLHLVSCNSPNSTDIFERKFWSLVSN